MEYYILTIFLIALIAIFYVWLKTKSISDDKIINLDTDNNTLLDGWYQRHIIPSISYDPNILALLLSRLLKIEVTNFNPEYLVIGTNLASQYSALTNQPLKTKYTPETDTLFNLRELIGISGEIAIIHDPRIRLQLLKNNEYDLSHLQAIINSNLDLIAQEYLQTVLTKRWNRILEFNDPHIVNKFGTYLYLHESSIPNIKGYQMGAYTRFNLLCTDREFEALIKRWPKMILK